MVTKPAPIPQPATAASPLSARRLLVLSGIALILTGMVFGDIFAIFILHQNASRVGASLTTAAYASLNGDVPTVQSAFLNVGGFQENRGTKVDTHVHMIDFGYMALLLALMQPWVALPEAARLRLAWLFLAGAVLLPVGVFLIHYVGLAHSPLASIGWASIFADLGGALVLLAVLAYFAGLLRHAGMHRATTPNADALLHNASALLFSAGIFLALLGFAHGAYYAATSLYQHEAADYNILARMTAAASAQNPQQLDAALTAYGQLQGDKAVTIAAHAHIIEFGMLALLLAFFQPYVALRDRWKHCWAIVLLAGSVLLPICVLMEIRFGLIAGALADFGGLLVIVALLAMWIGILRYRGSLDTA